MPRACAVETHAGDYKKAVETLRDATALRRGGLRLTLLVNKLTVAQSPKREPPRHKAVASLDLYRPSL